MRVLPSGGYALGLLRLKPLRETGSSSLQFGYATLTAASTLALICLGGIVTTKGVGMAVPDWPTSYGYNMFLFPPSQWMGGIFDEHVHRLAASAVGFLTMVLAFWFQWRCPVSAIRRLGWAALGLVLAQGILGGLRVLLDHQAVAGTTLGVLFGVAHACAGQAFFALIFGIALRLSPVWSRLQASVAATGDGAARLRPWLVAGAALIAMQLALGAAMRHQHAGLAIHDFPLAYGRLWPDTTPEALAGYNRHRLEPDPVTAGQIHLQLWHRAGAALTLATVVIAALKARRIFGPASTGTRLTAIWGFLILAQAALGVATVIFDKPADIATAHVAVGALSLAVGLSLNAALLRATRRARALTASPNGAPWVMAPSTRTT